MEFFKPTTEGAHYYDKQGNPKYTVTKKDGEQRPADLRDAKKHGWLPSVNTVKKGAIPMGFGLFNYLQDLLAQCIITTPREDGESYEQWRKKVNNGYSEARLASAKRGEQLHEYCESYIKGERFAEGPDAEVFYDKIQPWIDTHFGIGEAEIVLTNSDLGFAGKLDFLGVYDGCMADIDWKFQDKEEAKAWEDMLILHSAHSLLSIPGNGETLQQAGVKHINYIVPLKGGEPLIKEWSEKELEWGRRVFRNAIGLFRELKKWPYEN